MQKYTKIMKVSQTISTTVLWKMKNKCQNDLNEYHCRLTFFCSCLSKLTETHCSVGGNKKCFFQITTCSLLILASSAGLSRVPPKCCCGVCLMLTLTIWCVTQCALNKGQNHRDVRNN